MKAVASAAAVWCSRVMTPGLAHAGWGRRMRQGFSLLAIGAAMLPRAVHGAGCGMPLTAPVNRFEDVNDEGFVSYWRQLGDFDLGNGLTAPLLLNFRANVTESSAIAGRGWSLPLLESHFAQVSARRYILTEPDGWRLTFERLNPTDSVLFGSGGWVARIRGDTATAWAKCGWRLTFKDGRITEMSTPQGRHFEYHYENGRLRELTDNGAVVLSVAYDDPGRQTRITWGAHRVTVALGMQPMADGAETNPAPGRFTAATSITVDGREREDYRYAVAGGTYELEVRGNGDARTIAWDPSGTVVADGGWHYRVAHPSASSIDIRRTNAKGQEEAWARNPAAGSETTQLASGIRVEVHRFTAGPSAGKLASVVRSVPGRDPVTVYQAEFDDRGRLRREHTVLGRTEFEATIEPAKNGTDYTLTDAAGRYRVANGLISFADQ